MNRMLKTIFIGFVFFVFIFFGNKVFAGCNNDLGNPVYRSSATIDLTNPVAINEIIPGNSNEYDWWIINYYQDSVNDCSDNTSNIYATLSAADSAKYAKIVPIFATGEFNDGYSDVQPDDAVNGYISNSSYNRQLWYSASVDNGSPWYANCSQCSNMLSRWQTCLDGNGNKYYGRTYWPVMQDGEQMQENQVIGWTWTTVYYDPYINPCVDAKSYLKTYNSLSNEASQTISYYNPGSWNQFYFKVYDISPSYTGNRTIFKMYKAPENPPGSFDMSVSCNRNTNNCTRSAYVSWTEASAATSYRLDVYKNGSRVYDRTFGSTTRNYTYNIGTNDNAKYDFRVTAYNNFGSKVANQNLTSCNSTTAYLQSVSSNSSTHCVDESSDIDWRSCWVNSNSTYGGNLYQIKKKIGSNGYENSLTLYIIYTGITRYRAEKELNETIKDIDSSYEVDIRGLRTIITKKSISDETESMESRLPEIRQKIDDLSGFYSEIATYELSATPTIDYLTDDEFGSVNTNSQSYSDALEEEIYNSLIYTVSGCYNGSNCSTISFNFSACQKQKTYKGVFIANEIDFGQDSDYIINQDINIINNPPPGFSDLFSPLYEEKTP